MRSRHRRYFWQVPEPKECRLARSMLRRCYHCGAGNAFMQTEAFNLTDVSRANLRFFSKLRLREAFKNAEAANVFANPLVDSLGGVYFFTT